MRQELRDYIGRQAQRLYNDLCFAAPEMWPTHIQRRFSEVIEEIESNEANSDDGEED